jgi:hypothetical protein
MLSLYARQSNIVQGGSTEVQRIFFPFGLSPLRQPYMLLVSAAPADRLLMLTHLP